MTRAVPWRSPFGRGKRVKIRSSRIFQLRLRRCLANWRLRPPHWSNDGFSSISPCHQKSPYTGLCLAERVGLARPLRGLPADLPLRGCVGRTGFCFRNPLGKKTQRPRKGAFDFLAERVGFEPTVRQAAHLISSQARSTTPAPLQFVLIPPCGRIDSRHPWHSPFGRAPRVQIRSCRICDSRRPWLSPCGRALRVPIRSRRIGRTHGTASRTRRESIPPGSGMRIFWRGGRAVECTGLENQQGLVALRGFESHPLRQTKPRLGAFLVAGGDG